MSKKGRAAAVKAAKIKRCRKAYGGLYYGKRVATFNQDMKDWTAEMEAEFTAKLSELNEGVPLITWPTESGVLP